MPTEIERKFLVKGDYKKSSHTSYSIKQGYISRVPERTVRIRIRNKQGFITIKGKSNKSGLSRYEFEKEITIEEAESLLAICEEGVIEKTRYLIEFEGNTFEVDEFHGKKEGLVLAEIELENECQEFKKPLWLSTEVTGNKKYYNSYISIE